MTARSPLVHLLVLSVLAHLLMVALVALVSASWSSPAAVAAAAPAETNEELIARAKAWLESSRDVQLEDMRQYVEIPSVAAESKHDPDSRRAAEWLRSWLVSRLGMADAALYESGYRNPVVIASTGDYSKPAIVIYGHYDIQPADGHWTISGPYELLVKALEGYGEVMTGRGASDCKGARLHHRTRRARPPPCSRRSIPRPTG